MTRRTNARVAGFAFLCYIALGIPSMILLGKATHGEGIAAKLASVALHASDVRLAMVFDLLTCFAALALGVTLYAITRDQDPDLAMLGLACRVAEGVVAGAAIHKTLGLLAVATATGADASSPEAVSALGTFLFSGSVTVPAMFFSVGSTIFSWLLLRGRMIPAPLAWLGVIASVLLVVALPLRLGGVLSGTVVQYLWLPMAAFEIPLALWFLIKGVAAPAKQAAAAAG